MTGTLREDLCTFMIISRSILLRMRSILGGMLSRKSKHAFYIQPPPPPPEYHAACVMIYRNMVEPMPVQYGACALHPTCLRLQTHLEYVIGTYRSCTATVGTRTLFSVLLYVYCFSCHKVPSLGVRTRIVINYWCFCRSWIRYLCTWSW
jgi:hypothetical protein